MVLTEVDEKFIITLAKEVTKANKAIDILIKDSAMMRNKLNAMQAGKTLDSLLSAFKNSGIIPTMTPQEMENKINSMSSELAHFQLEELKRNEELKNKIEFFIKPLTEINECIDQLNKSFTMHKEYMIATIQRMDTRIDIVKETFIPPKVISKWKFW